MTETIKAKVIRWETGSHQSVDVTLHDGVIDSQQVASMIGCKWVDVYPMDSHLAFYVDSEQIGVNQTVQHDSSRHKLNRGIKSMDDRADLFGDVLLVSHDKETDVPVDLTDDDWQQLAGVIAADCDLKCSPLYKAATGRT